MVLAFSKWQGAGNDFILIEDFDGAFPEHEQELIAKLCHRQLGIGADGLLLLQKSRIASVKMRYYNADGQEAAMCGNGLRCLFRHAFEQGYCQKEDRIETKNALHHCFMQENSVRVSMGKAKVVTWELQGDGFEKGYLVDTGVPHLVIFESDIENVDVNRLGAKIRQSAHFAKEGVNVDFVQASNPIALRTYERGVEAETFACGTGVVASAFVAKALFNLDGQIRVKTRLGHHLEVAISPDDECVLCGPAERVFTGTFNL